MDTYNDTRKRARRAQLGILAAGTAILMFLGLVYAWSIFSAPFQRAYGWDSLSLTSIFCLSMVSFCIGGFISSVAMKKTSPKITILMAGILVGLGLTCTGLLASLSIWAIHSFYGILVGLGCGFGYNSIISTVNAWYLDRVGISSGVLLAGFGFATFLLGPAINAMAAGFGLTLTFSLLGVGSFILFVPAAMAIRLPRDEELSLLLRKAPDQRIGPSSAGSSDASLVITASSEAKDMVSSASFGLYLLWFVTVGIACLTLIGASAQSVAVLGIDASLGSFIIGLFSVANGIARLVAGLMAERIGLAKSMITLSVCGFIGSMLITGSFFSREPYLFISGAMLMGLCYGGMPVMSSSFTMKRFGPQHYPTNFAIASACIIPSSILAMLGDALICDLAGAVLLYAGYAVFAAFGIVVAIVFGKRYEDEMRSRRALV